MNDSACATAVEPCRPRVQLLGIAAARPEGLERALVRAGLAVVEAAPGGADPAAAPDLLLIIAPAADAALDAEMRAAAARWGRRVPRVAVLAAGGQDAVAAALAMGADDAVAAPVHAGELVARLRARLHPPHAAANGRNGDAYGAAAEHAAMFDLVQEVYTSRRAEEILQTLVRRVGRALDLSHCSFIVTSDGNAHGRVLAEYDRPTSRDFRLDLTRYPEVLEAVRTAAPVVVPNIHAHPLFEEMRRQWAEQQLEVRVRSVVALPVSVAGRVMGVFLLRTRDPDVELTADQVAFADSLARAAARVLAAGDWQRRDGEAAGDPSVDPLTGCGTADALGERLRAEFERARRYALSFSVVLLDIDHLAELNTRLGDEAGDRLLADVGAMLRRELRAPDFVSRYGGDEFAVLLPETGHDGARRSVHRLCARLAALPPAELPSGARMRLSAGIVTLPHPAAHVPDDLLALAEAALLRGKAQSGERIGTAESVG